MEKFFIGGSFYSDIEDYKEELGLTEEEILNLDDNWSIMCEYAELEKICQLDKGEVSDLIYSYVLNKFEHRLPEDDGKFDIKLERAILNNLDLSTVNENMPELYYPIGEFFEITKQDLIHYFC